MGDVPDFSEVAEEYAASRPLYPPELFEWLASLVDVRGTAWDTATGNGQAAIGLATHFTHVIATDLSPTQLRHARQHPRIEYRVAPAEASGLPADSVDLVVAAAAIHWFDLDRFFREVKRVIHGGGVLAAWTYHVAQVGPPLDGILWPLYRDVVGKHFAAGARMVDAHYDGLRLPGKALQAPAFRTTARWSAEEVLKFVRTWSGVQSYMAATKQDPVEQIAAAVRDVFGGDNAVQEVSWPLYIRAARQ
jgi:ubiquinone/menaquinone biosynthesis C-methylase UbiE